MVIELTFDVAGDRQLSRSLSRFGDSVKDLSPAFREIAKNFHEIEKKQFASQGGYGSGGWAPLSPTYAEWKARHYPGAPILRRTGRLLSSLIGKTQDTIEEIGKHDLSLGTSVPYSIFHQKGRGVPRRPVIELTEKDKSNWMKIIQKWLVDQARKAGLR